MYLLQFVTQDALGFPLGRGNYCNKLFVSCIVIRLDKKVETHFYSLQAHITAPLIMTTTITTDLNRLRSDTMSTKTEHDQLHKSGIYIGAVISGCTGVPNKVAAWRIVMTTHGCWLHVSKL